MERVVFRNREEAAAKLLEHLVGYRDQDPLVLGIPRGGVPMALSIAEALHGQLDVALVRKLRAPFRPELAIGAVDEQGRTWIAAYAEETGADRHYLRLETEDQHALLRQRRTEYTPGRTAISCQERLTIVVDDGVATGSTLTAALKGIRAQNPKWLVAAVGVAPTEALDKIAKEADEVICGYHTADFAAVGQFYEDFTPVTDDEVMAALQELAPTPGLLDKPNE